MPALMPYDKQLPYTYAPGIYPAMEALLYQAQAVTRVLVHSRLKEGEGAQALLALCQKLGIRVEVADKALKRITGKDNTYAAAVVRKLQQALALTANHLVLVQPMDAGNLGTILRTALGFGYRDIALIKPCTDPFDPQVIRASMGAMFQLQLTEYAGIDNYMEQHPRHQLYPFMLTGSLPLKAAVHNKKSPHSLVFGNEGSGLDDSYASLGTPVRIEQTKMVDSLNLSVAAAVAMYAFSTIQGT